MRRRLSRSGREKMKVIGYAGTQSGCGTTHFVWCTANYLSNVRKSRVMVCRTGTGHSYGQARVILNAAGDDAQFMYGNVTFLTVTDESMVESAQEAYDYILLDLGQADYVGDNILRRCDELFLVGDLSVWNCTDSASAMLRMRRRYDKKLCFVSAFCSKAGLRKYEKFTGERAVIIPFDAEPFAVSRDTLIFMERIFGESIEVKRGK